MWLCIRNLTKDYDTNLNLPVETDELEQILGDCEWIIIDHENTLSLGEYHSIREVNEFLLECQDMWDVDDDTLSILSRTYLYEEVMEMVRAESFTIINFTAETSGWNYGHGGDIYNEDTLGRVMHDYGMIFDWERKYPITEEMEDDIQWENLWTTAVCTGWRTVSYKDNDYIVHRQECE